MKTETEVTIEVTELKANQCLHNEPDGFVLKIFMACSQARTRTFRLAGPHTPIQQTLKVRNIAGRQLQFWLCTTHDKIIANADLPLPLKLNELQESVIDLKMTNTVLASLSLKISASKRQIEKLVYVQPDEELLKKTENSYEKQRKEEEQLRRAKEYEEQQAALKQVKKPPITISQFNRKDIPFV